MSSKKYLLISLSALMYILPFIWSRHLWWLVFLFPVPLMYLILERERLSFKQGYVWGLITVSGHLSGVLYSIAAMADGPYWIRVIPAILITAWAAFYSACWFWLSSVLSEYISHRHKNIFALAIWVCTSTLFVIWIDQFCLSFFNTIEGYFLMHPLLPLAEKPLLLQPLLSLFGKTVLTFLFFCLAAGIAFLLHKMFLLGIISLGCMLTLWTATAFLSTSAPQPPAWLSKITSVQTSFYSFTSFITPLIQNAALIIKEKLQNKPEAEVVILPESTFNLAQFTTIPALCSFFNSSKLGKPVHMIFGAFRWDTNNEYRNSLIWLYDGVLQSYFDKRHAMVLTERVPWIANIPAIQQLYFTLRPQITPSNNPRRPLTLVQDIAVVPYICSELFFNNAPDDDFPELPILAICNDSWIETPYVARLMYLIARFKALEWKRDIIYVSYYFSTFITQQGTEFSIS